MYLLRLLDFYTTQLGYNARDVGIIEPSLAGKCFRACTYYKQWDRTARVVRGCPTDTHLIGIEFEYLVGQLVEIGIQRLDVLTTIIQYALEYHHQISFFAGRDCYRVAQAGSVCLSAGKT